VAEQKSALAKHRLLGSTSKIIGANRMQSALEILREAQAEKLRQEAEEYWKNKDFKKKQG
jgi:hypothetical protein